MTKLSRILGTRVVVAGASVLLMIGCAGCSASMDMSGRGIDDGSPAQLEGGGDGFVGFEAIKKEYAEAVSELPLPQGFEPPDNLFDTYDTDGAFQIGFGDGEALSVALCAWEQRALDTRTSDPEASSAAIDLVEELTKGPIAKDVFDPDTIVPAFEERIAKARLGDWSGVSSDLEINCEGFYLGVEE